jgi:hypothetical protein
MKKILIAIFAIAFLAPLAFGDEVGRELSTISNQQIRTQTRAMVNAGIPVDDAVKVTRLMIENNYKNQNTIRAQNILMATVKENLPVKPVMNKALEGIAKNVNEDLVIRAMEQTRHQYSIAYKHARQITQDKDQMHHIAKVIAEGFRAGIHNTDAVEVMNRIQNRSQQRTQAKVENLAKESFLSLRDMARLSISSKTAREVVCHALDQQYTAQEMNQMRHSFMTRSMNTNPVKLANQYSYAIRNGLKAENLNSNQMMNSTKSGISGHQGGFGSSGSGHGGGSGGGPGGGAGGGAGGGSGGGAGGGGGGGGR